MPDIFMQMEMSKLTKMLIAHGLSHLKVGARGNSIYIFSEFEGKKENRCRLSQISKNNYKLSMANHNGKWENTPFNGNSEELLDMIMSDFEWVLSDYNII